MFTVNVIDDPDAAAAALDPVRNRLLAELREPASAAELASRLSLPRQKVNYHLRTLEAHGLVTVDSTRQWGGLTERKVVAAASSFVVSPAALGPIATDPEREADRLSASYLIALAARAIREVSALIQGALKAQKKLAVLSVDSEVRFRSAADRAAFTTELSEAINGLVAKYHDGSAPGGRRHRLILMVHPLAPATSATSTPKD